MSTKHYAALDTDVGLVIETVFCCEYCSEPRLTLLLAWVQGCTTITTLLVLSWLQGSATWQLCTECPDILPAGVLCWPQILLLQVCTAPLTYLLVTCQRMNKKERFAGLCFVLLLMLFESFIDNSASAYGEQW